MIRPILLLLCVLIPTATCAALDIRPRSDAPVSPVRPPVKAEIDPGEVLGHLRYLADPSFRGREAGSAEEKTAANYIADEFKRYGLQPRGAIVDGSAGWFQAFPMTVPTGGAGESTLEALFGNERGILRRFARGDDFIPVPAAKKKIEGQPGGLAFAGYGIVAPEYEYDDFGSVDLAGQWALVLRFEPQEFNDKSVFAGKELTKHAGLAAKIGNCAHRRARGVLVVTGPVGREEEDDGVGDPPATFVGDFPIPVFIITREVADQLLTSSGQTVGRLQQAIDRDLKSHALRVPNVEMRGLSDIGIRSRPAQNVIGWLQGSDPVLREEYVVLGAHHDHVGMGYENSMLGRRGAGLLHPGADDNASGVSALLEAAQLAGALQPGERPKRSLIFMTFSGEEQGLIGSRYFLENPTVPIEKIAAMINLDMVGRADGGVQVGGIGTAKGLRELVNANAVADLKEVLASAGNGPSDHASFDAKKIPVLFLFTGLHPDYHRPSDTWEKVDVRGAAAVSRLAWALLRALADLPEWLAYRASGGGAYLGVGGGPPTRDGKGYVIGSILPNSPAENAGLQPGDLILAVNDRVLNAAMELPLSLIDFSPGDSVEVEVARAGRRFKQTITLAPRPPRK